jgi:hypothetical protein
MNNQIKLSNGEEITLDLTNKKQFYGEFVDKFLKPLYKETNDWLKTVNSCISEVESISILFHLKKGEIITELLHEIDERLAKDISELKGLDKIEILFENIDDYVEQIAQLVGEEKPTEETRLNVSKLVENLNLFEIAELLIHFAKTVASLDNRITG